MIPFLAGKEISRITKFHINEHQSKLLPYPLSLKQRNQETILVERGCGSRFIIANTAIIRCLFHDVVNRDVDRNVPLLIRR